MESARPSVFTSSNGEGVERVIKGKGESHINLFLYCVYFMELYKYIK